VVCSGQWGGQAVETYKRTGKSLDRMYLAGVCLQIVSGCLARSIHSASYSAHEKKPFDMPHASHWIGINWKMNKNVPPGA